MVSNLTLAPGDNIRLETPGGGGLGNPTERDPIELMHDLRDDRISRDRAEFLYGTELVAKASTTV